MRSPSSSLNKAAPPRVVVESVRPEVDGGRYPVKRAIGEQVLVECDAFADGHDAVAAELLYKYSSEEEWQAVPMEFRHNDHWAAPFTVHKLGRYQYKVRAWTDPFVTWQRDLVKRRDAGQDLSIDFLIGAQLLPESVLSDTSRSADERYDAAMKATPPRPAPEAVVESQVLEVVVDPVRARFSTWYEMFPRSARGDGRHATFRDVVELLPYVQEMGFDVLYFPPIHPIGSTARKGKNNAVSAAPDDVGSPWAIGASEGGHDAIDPTLGDEADLATLVETLHANGMELALDLALQTSPDHPWLSEHPDWFQHRPDGSLKYAENPPKRYQDIHNFDWETKDRKALWEAIRTVVLRWCEAGVTVFRVDNPHTKPIPLWEWLIAEVRKRHPETVFLSEAFTRPPMMTLLAKAGFSQSYTYFTWKNTKWELIELVEQLREWSPYLRPNLWPNTPDILHATLQQGGRPAFECRLVLAATLSASYGIYSGYERCENAPVRAGSEEYLDSEKYQLRERSFEGPLLPLVRRLNETRRAHPALTGAGIERLTWLETESEHLLGYARALDDDVVLVVVNLDPYAIHEGVCLVPAALGLPDPLDVVDALTGETYTWGARNFVRLAPGGAHVMVRAR